MLITIEQYLKLCATLQWKRKYVIQWSASYANVRRISFIATKQTKYEIRNEEMKKKNNKIQMKTNNNAIVEDKHSQFAGDLIGW